MKKRICILAALLAVSAAGCGEGSHVGNRLESTYDYSPGYSGHSYRDSGADPAGSYTGDSGSGTGEDTFSPSASFTNKTGTSTTKCLHPGCDSYIAPSGDTYYCIPHSKKCGACGCYIDEDAMFCPDCIIDAFTE